MILLENCISNFSDDEQYRNDARFLKICILYVMHPYVLINRNSWKGIFALID